MDFCSRPAMRSISSSIEALVMRHSSLLLMVCIYRMSGCGARWYLGRITDVVRVWEFARSSCDEVVLYFDCGSKGTLE